MGQWQSNSTHRMANQLYVYMEYNHGWTLWTPTYTCWRLGCSIKNKICKSKCLFKRSFKDGTCIVTDSGNMAKQCMGFHCDERGVFFGGKAKRATTKERFGPWRPDLGKKEIQDRKSNGWSNQFAFPWEVGMMYDFTVGGEMQRPMGCKGLDEPFGTLDKPLWVQGNTNSPIWNSPAMQCGLNNYAPEGKPMHEIIEDLASDNEFFAETFLEAYDLMTANGYLASDLRDGPQNGWFGH